VNGRDGGTASAYMIGPRGWIPFSATRAERGIPKGCQVARSPGLEARGVVTSVQYGVFASAVNEHAGMMLCAGRVPSRPCQLVYAQAAGNVPAALIQRPGAGVALV
jgi:hypothetical protein